LNRDKEEAGACGVHRLGYEKDYMKICSVGRTSLPKKRGRMKKKKSISCV
jgi:hypothetical protein